MDSFYFGRSYGVMLFRDPIKGRNLHWVFIQHETVELYKEGIHYLQSKGYEIKGIVCDGKKGLFQAFPGIPVQMCQFHQLQIMKRYLTSKPKLQAAIELKDIMKLLTKTDKESFTGAFNDWRKKWEVFLKEKSIDKVTGKWHYTHKNLRSAAHSVKINLPNLFTWYDFYDRNIPNTNNSVEGTITNIKIKTKVHQGLNRKRKIKLIEKLLRK